jgi:hypothetical protein
MLDRQQDLSDLVIDRHVAKKMVGAALSNLSVMFSLILLCTEPFQLIA